MRLAAIEIGKTFANGTRVGPTSLEVSSGELVAIIGPSGSGKTTTLSIIGGFSRPTVGRVLLDSINVGRQKLQSQVTWVSQGAHSLGPRTTLDNVVLGALADGAQRRHSEHAGFAALERLGLAHRSHDQAVDLSGGELQRLAIARAMCSSRPFVFADEPTGNLDRKSTMSVIRALRTMVDVGNQCTVVATHDREVADSADRVINLSRTNGGDE